MPRKKLRGPIYSVVDLETTGTSVKNGDRIIQIGCALVQDGVVVNHFETLVNPRTKIPHQIEQLTGITNKAVQSAPLFEDIAGTVFSLLTGTIFVAHNVNFDFPFLNRELERSGYPTLTIQAIDTVTLSQILLPTAKSYRLRDLTAYLTIEHDHPHSAASDADATAQLLIDLLDKLANLPTITLRQLVSMKLELPQQTADVFATELGRRKRHPVKLPESLYVTHGLVLHKQRHASVNISGKQFKYPSTTRAKKRLFGNHLTVRPAQAKLMNAIYNHYRQDKPEYMVVEAGTGIGKTIGYLLPLLYHAFPDRRLVVSTATNLLQQQIAEQTMNQLNQVLPFAATSVVVKGSSHYLNLTKFVHSLGEQSDSKLVQLLKAKILVWLLQTTNGDLDELNMTSQNSPYFAEIRHQGVQTLDAQGPYYQDDFLVRQQTKLRHANVIITNHSYLAAHASELGTQNGQPYLVVDEAQHLSDSVLKMARHTISFQELLSNVNTLRGLVNDDNEFSLFDTFSSLPLADYNVELLTADLRDLDEAIGDFQQALYRQFIVQFDSNSAERIIESPIDNEQLGQLLSLSSSLMMNLEQALASTRLHFRALEHIFETRCDSWLPSDRGLMNQFSSHLDKLAQADDTLHDFLRLLDERASAAVFWLTIQQSHERSSMKLSGGLMESNHFLSEKVYPHFHRPLFIGATLFNSSRSQYLYNQLDIERQETKVKRFASPFDYQQNSELLIAKDAPQPASLNNGHYISYLSRTIRQLADSTQCQTMVLFNSLLTIEQVYSQLRGTDLFNQRDILAQGITGSREKLLKQFATGNNAVLLGASSFWEGIDLPRNLLQLLVITRLPFDSPNEIITRAQSSLLQQAGKNPFYQLQLPKATIRLRQGVGRLLRTPDDYGVAVCLDPRLYQRRYGKSMQGALPKEMPKKVLPTDQLISQTKKFLNDHRRRAKR